MHKESLPTPPTPFPPKPRVATKGAIPKYPRESKEDWYKTIPIPIPSQSSETVNPYEFHDARTLVGSMYFEVDRPTESTVVLN
jgi:hypothetical protein